MTGYGRCFAAWRDDAGAAWDDYVRHDFVQGMADGTLPRQAFLAYLVQDYRFLIHFSRAWALGVVKAGTLAEMRACVATVDALLNHETSLHVRVCGDAGITAHTHVQRGFVVQQRIHRRHAGPHLGQRAGLDHAERPGAAEMDQEAVVLHEIGQERLPGQGAVGHPLHEIVADVVVPRRARIVPPGGEAAPVAGHCAAPGSIASRSTGHASPISPASFRNVSNRA